MGGRAWAYAVCPSTVQLHRSASAVATRTDRSYLVSRVQHRSVCVVTERCFSECDPWWGDWVVDGRTRVSRCGRLHLRRAGEKCYAMRGVCARHGTSYMRERSVQSSSRPDTHARGDLEEHNTCIHENSSNRPHISRRRALCLPSYDRPRTRTGLHARHLHC